MKFKDISNIKNLLLSTTRVKFEESHGTLDEE
jgi:hypothetical protein